IEIVLGMARHDEHDALLSLSATMRSDDDVDLVVALDDFVSPQAVSAIAGAAAGLAVEFPAVARAHDLQVVGVAHAAVGLVGTDVLFDAMDQQPLADRTALVGALVVIGVEPAIGAHDADG